MHMNIKEEHTMNKKALYKKKTLLLSNHLFLITRHFVIFYGSVLLHNLLF